MTTTELHDCFLYVECDIPPGMSIAEWRREHAHAARPPRRHAWLARLHLALAR